MIVRKIKERLYYFKVSQLGIEGIARDPKDFWSLLPKGTRLYWKRNTYGNKGGMRLIKYVDPFGHTAHIEHRGILIHGIPSGVFKPEFSRGCIVPIKKIENKQSLICKCFKNHEVPTVEEMEDVYDIV